LIPAYGRDGERNEALLRTRAWENSVWVVYVRQNQALVINPSGKIIARDKGEGDELVLARIDLGGEKGTGEIFERRSPEVYHELVELHRPERD
jgi:predicted amidohydrolase